MRMNIIIDSREKGRRERASTYYTNKGHKANVETLDVGDYLFDDRVVFEYKIMSDFMSSFKGYFLIGNSWVTASNPNVTFGEDV